MLLILALACSAEAPDRAEVGSTATTQSAAPASMVLHVEAADGSVIETARAEQAINPASLVKTATTLWALEILGPEHRFETRFGYRGTFDRDAGRIDGDLIVQGTGDPDFHVENAYLVGAELNRLGVREIRGGLRVNARFWLGWEGGSEKREHDSARRSQQMAARLRDALDPQRWTAATRKSIVAFEKRRGFAVDQRPRVTVSEAGRGGADGDTEPLLVHRSNPLVVILKRFNAYSNNDIERLGVSLGTAAELSGRLARRWNVSEDNVRLKTLSGLDTNRLTPRQVVRVLRELEQACTRFGIGLGDVLPVVGCDPGTLKHYPRLRDRLSGNLTAKTGSLNVTDGGVSALAGVLDSARGRRIFCVATPGAGGQLPVARARQERWVLDLVARSGGAAVAECGPRPGFSDQSAEIQPTLK